jgi:hypothetical protein
VIVFTDNRGSPEENLTLFKESAVISEQMEEEISGSQTYLGGGGSTAAEAVPTRRKTPSISLKDGSIDIMR